MIYICYLWATSASSSFHTNSLISDAVGWGPSTPFDSKPFATFDRCSLCFFRILSLTAYGKKFQKNIEFCYMITII